MLFPPEEESTPASLGAVEEGGSEMAAGEGNRRQDQAAAQPGTEQTAGLRQGELQQDETDEDTGAEVDFAEDDANADDVGEPQVPSGPGSVGLARGPQPTESSASTTGPFDVDTLTQGLRDGPDYGTQTLFYPTDAEPPFAMVAVVPGFISPESSIRQWGPFLASHGMVVLTIGTNSGGDPPDARADALMDALETVAAENERVGGPLAGKLDLDRRAVMGWSMGGGGTLIAASDNPDLSAAISLAGWSPGVRFSDNEVPTLLFAGTADPLAGGQSQGFFESIPDTTPKMLFEVAGGNHSVANAPTGAGGQVGLYGLSWLKVFLEGDERYLPFLLETPSRQSDFRQNLQ